MDIQKVVEAARLAASDLEAWVEAGWLTPQRHEGAHQFSEIDVARAQLIRDLKRDFGVNDHGVPVILDLVDQIHGLRRSMSHLMAALRAQPEETRTRIVGEIRGRRYAVWLDEQAPGAEDPGSAPCS